MLTGAASALSTLPGTATPFASTLAMCRFLANPAVTLPALIEPAQDDIRAALARSPGPVALVVHDWSSLHFHDAGRKKDLRQRTHAYDTGYELAAALVLDSHTGRPLGPMELRLRTADGVLSTRPTATAAPPGHVDEVLDAMAASAAWGLDRPRVHVIDREADSVDHYRRWAAAGHTFLVRADDDRVVKWSGAAVRLSELATRPGLDWRPVRGADGPTTVTVGGRTGALWVCEAAVVLDRPGRKRVDGRRVDVRGEPLPLRLVMTWVLADDGELLAEWYLFTNAGAAFDAAAVGRWYSWRWWVESYFKLLKSAGQKVEQWEQHGGLAVAKRLVLASTACLTVWCLQREPGPAAAEVRRVLVVLSGRQMGHGVESTASALSGGLGKLLAVLDLLAEYDLTDLRRLVAHVLPNLFDSG